MQLAKSKMKCSQQSPMGAGGQGGEGMVHSIFQVGGVSADWSLSAYPHQGSSYPKLQCNLDGTDRVWGTRKWPPFSLMVSTEYDTERPVS